MFLLISLVLENVVAACANKKFEARSDGTESWLVQLEGDYSPSRGSDWHTLTRKARREQVGQELMAQAVRSQASLSRFLTELGVPYRSFWIVNAIVINRADISEELLCQVAERFDVKKVTSPVLESVRFVEDLAAARPVLEDKKDDQTVEWNLEVVNAPEAWNLTRGEGVVVGVIDGGVRYTHEALVGGYRGNAGGVYNHDFNWHDPVYGERTPLDTDGHGSHCLGSAVGSNGIGVAPGSKWIASKNFNWAGYADPAWTLSATQWMLCPTPVRGGEANCSLGADVVSCSWGTSSSGNTYLMEIVNAWEQAGMVPVFAAGNCGSACGTGKSPSDYSAAIAVGATDNRNTLATFSSRGPGGQGVGFDPQVPLLVAPGVSVRSVDYTSDRAYIGKSGTSMAAPHVAGTAALILSLDPTADRRTVSAALQLSAAWPVAVNSGSNTCGGVGVDQRPNYHVGFGLLDAAAALAACSQK